MRGWVLVCGGMGRGRGRGESKRCLCWRLGWKSIAGVLAVI
jgi:hypothetical protein